MGYTNDQLTEMVNVGQSIYFVNLVIMQCFGNFFATRTLTLSILQHNPFRGENKNKYCFYAIPASLAVMFLVLYIPPCNSVLGTRPVPPEFYFISLAFSMSIIIYDEIRKLLKRNRILGFQHTIWQLVLNLISGNEDIKSISVLIIKLLLRKNKIKNTRIIILSFNKKSFLN